jgi:hypothetical protein
MLAVLRDPNAETERRDEMAKGRSAVHPSAAVKRRSKGRRQRARGSSGRTRRDRGGQAHSCTAALMALSARERAIRLRLKADLEYYAVGCLKIRTKAGNIGPLIFNRMQRFLHSRIENHAKRNGRVRVLILKARQQGCSTYVGARFYWKATHARGQQVFILTHEQDATDNLFDMAQRFHEHCPALVRPHTGASNAKELAFDVLDSI